MSDPAPAYHYLAYIDESGDTGLAAIRPEAAMGSSEWLVVSAVVVRTEHEAQLDDWLSAMRSGFVNFKASNIHFSKLTDTNKEAACSYIARRPVKIFAVCSNKKNMKGYDNPFASMRSLDRNWFYCWLTRVLLERVTYFINRDAAQRYDGPRNVKLVFSNRGGLSYSQMKAYFELLKLQGGVGGLHLEKGRVYFNVIDQRLVQIAPHYALAGLKLADITASAFFKGCDIYHTKQLDLRYASLLKPRVASTQYQAKGEFEEYTTFAGYGVKLLPSLTGARLKPEQEELFRLYGYPRQWWDPTPLTSSPYRMATVAIRSIERRE